MGKCPVTPWPSPSPAGPIASAEGRGCPDLTASGQGSQLLACPAPPAQSRPGFPAPHLLPHPCHRRLPPELSPLLGVRNTAAPGPSQRLHFPEAPTPHDGQPVCKAQPAHASAGVGWGGVLPAPVNSLGLGLPWAPYSGKLFLSTCPRLTLGPGSRGARAPLPGPGRKMVPLRKNTFSVSSSTPLTPGRPTLASTGTLPPQLTTPS